MVVAVTGQARNVKRRADFSKPQKQIEKQFCDTSYACPLPAGHMADPICAGGNGHRGACRQREKEHRGDQESSEHNNMALIHFFQILSARKRILPSRSIDTGRENDGREMQLILTVRGTHWLAFSQARDANFSA